MRQPEVCGIAVDVGDPSEPPFAIDVCLKPTTELLVGGSVKIKHHTVSRFYLSQFAAAHGQKVIWEYAKGDGGNAAQRSPKVCACEDYFYAMEGADGAIDCSLEDAIAEVERQCAPAIKRISQSHPITATDRDLIAYFIGLLFLRVQGMRDHAELEKREIESAEGTRQWVEWRREEMERRFGGDVVAKFLEDVANRGHGVIMKRNFHLIDLFARAQAVADVVKQMDWTVNICKKEQLFITSDNPAFVRRPMHLRDPGIVGIKRADLNAELGFPLSRRSYLLAKWGRSAGLHSIQVAKLRVRELNTRTVLSANRYVYSPARCDEIARLVTENEDFTLTYPPLPPIASRANFGGGYSTVS